jgi:hypothetical protein
MLASISLVVLLVMLWPNQAHAQCQACRQLIKSFEKAAKANKGKTEDLYHAMKTAGCLSIPENRRALYNIVAKPPWVSSGLFFEIIELAKDNGETEQLMNPLAADKTIDEVLCRLVSGVVEANNEKEQIYWLNWLTAYYKTNGWEGVPPLQQMCLTHIHAIFPQAETSPAFVHGFLKTCRPGTVSASWIASNYLAVLYKLHLSLSADDLHLVECKIPFSDKAFWDMDLRPIIKDQGVLLEYQALISEKKIVLEGDSIEGFVKANCQSMAVAD